MNSKSLWNYIVSKGHILPSPLANKLGIPVLRTIIANLIIRIRRFKNCRPKNDYEKTLIKDGIVVIPDFLPEEEFRQLKKEINDGISDTKEPVVTGVSKSGSTQSTYYSFINEKYKNFPAIQNFLKNKQLIRLIAFAEGSKVFNEIGSFRFEKTIFGNPKGDTDNNVPFHADVHFHSHKVLFYTSNVTEDEGPFAYCLKSHKNDFDRLWFEFKRGQLKDSHKNSWRIEEHLDNKFFKNYFQKLMKNKYKVVGKPNTLIIANVHGFHQRGEALEGTSRSLIRIPYRYNPLGPQKVFSPDMYSGSLF